MKSIHARLTIFLAVTGIIAAVLGAAAAAGGRMATTIAVLELSESRPERIAYMLVDVERGLTTRHTLSLPYGIDARWWALPPLVLQRVDRFEFADWTLSRLDTRTNTLATLMKVTTPDNARVRTLDAIVRDLPDGRLHVSLYVPHTGEIWVAASDAPHATLLATVERNLTYPLHWSPDGTQLAVKSTEYAGITVMNADGSRQRSFNGTVNSWPIWSPDSSKLLFAPAGVPSASADLQILDTRSDTLSTPFASGYATWCGSGHIAYLDPGTGSPAALRIGDTAAGTNETVLLQNAPSVFEPSVVMPVQDDSCDWLLLQQRRRGDSFLLHRESGRMLPLGVDVRVVERGADALVYAAVVGENTELRRIALVPDLRGYEVMARYPRTLADVRWLDGWQRGLFLDYRTLALLDTTRDEWTALTAPVVQTFSVVE